MSKDTEVHNPFDSNYKKKQDFFRKSNVKRILVLTLLVAVFYYGYRNEIYATMMYYSVHNELDREVESMYLYPDGSTYRVKNISPYNIMLQISCDAKDFKSSYSGTVILPNQSIYISFYGNDTTRRIITFRGVKVG